MIRRTGATLVEVLVAIFVTALGLLGLLALFPLGALSMAQAIQDSRAAQAAATAASIAEVWQIRNDPRVLDLPTKDAFVDANYPVVPPTVRPAANAVNLDGPSYPVYVDPFGAAFSKVLPVPPNMPGRPGIPRQNVSFVNSFPQAVRWFSILDDMTFLKESYDGLPCPPGGSVQRDNRYSWAYLLRRPRASDRSVVDLTVVAYSGRPLQTTLGENAYGPVVFSPNSNIVKVPWDTSLGQEKPVIRPGGWILDATMLDAQGRPDPHGFFHRVVSVSDGADGGDDADTASRPFLLLELETKPKLPTTVGVLVVMENVVEVFERGPGRQP